MRTLHLAVGCVVGVVCASCYQWPDGAALEGDPGTHGIPARGDLGGRSPASKLDHERNPRQREPKHGLHDGDAPPAVAISAGSGPTLDTGEAAKAQGQEGHGIPGSGTMQGTTSSGGTTGSGATTGGATTGGAR